MYSIRLHMYPQDLHSMEAMRLNHCCKTSTVCEHRDSGMASRYDVGAE